MANEVFRRAHPKVLEILVSKLSESQGWTIGEFLRYELLEKRNLRIFSGLSEQEVDQLSFQKVTFHL